MIKPIYHSRSPRETTELGFKLAEKLRPGDRVLLYGDLGSGKTHFIKGLAKGLGIEEKIKSPTYAYVNSYGIRNQESGIRKNQAEFRIPNPESRLYHYDLYRFDEGADFASIGFEETLNDPEAINVVEWADRLGEFVLDHFISVYLDGEDDRRNIEIHFQSSEIVPESLVEALYNEWATPLHVREHCAQVTDVAMQVAQAYITKGIIVNADLLYAAGMLHDLCRLCDFKELKRDWFREEVSDQKWQLWQIQHKEHKGQHHADIVSEYLKEKGFLETAEVIRMHKSTNIVKEPEGYDSLEKKILYYADKRVKHTEVVSLSERFRDGKERYGKYNAPKEQELFDQVELKTIELERELFSRIDLKPTDIK